MPEAISHLKDTYFDLPIFLQIYILFALVPLIGWFVILGWLPQVKLQSLRWMISWLLDNYHRFFPIVFVVFATTDLLARPGLTTAVDGIVVPTDSIKLTIELLDRAKIGVLIYGLLFLLASAYAAAPNRLSPYPGQTSSRKLEKSLEETAHLLAEGVASLAGNVSQLPRRPASRSDGSP